MKYMEFKNKFQNLPLIFTKDTLAPQKDRQAVRNQLERWQDRGLIIKLKRGLYLLNKDDRRVNVSRCFVANQLYAPSYVSLEYALNFYGLIPERVVEVTSVTTKKTARFTNGLGVFVYQCIKPEAFRGFKAAEDEYGLKFFIAEPEKAVVDFLYLNIDRIRVDDREIFAGSFRFQNTEILKERRVGELAGLFKNKKLEKIAKSFCQFIKKER